jgi:hypothetical protein
VLARKDLSLGVVAVRTGLSIDVVRAAHDVHSDEAGLSGRGGMQVESESVAVLSAVAAGISDHMNGPARTAVVRGVGRCRLVAAHGSQVGCSHRRRHFEVDCNPAVHQNPGYTHHTANWRSRHIRSAVRSERDWRAALGSSVGAAARRMHSDRTP